MVQHEIGTLFHGKNNAPVRMLRSTEDAGSVAAKRQFLEQLKIAIKEIGRILTQTLIWIEYDIGGSISQRHEL